MGNESQEVSRGLSRRTVTKAAAWSVPVIAAAVAVPARAASVPTQVMKVDIVALPMSLVSASDAPVPMTINGTVQPTYRPTLDSGGTGTTLTYQVGFTITNDPTSTVPFPVDGAILSIGYHDSAQLGLSTGPNTLFSFMDLPNRDTNLTNVTPGFSYAFANEFRLGPDQFEYSAYEGGYITVDQYAFVLPSVIPPGGSLRVTFNYTVHAEPIANIQQASNLAAPVTVTNQPRSAGGLSTTATAAGWTETNTSNNYGPNDQLYQNFTYLS